MDIKKVARRVLAVESSQIEDDYTAMAHTQQALGLASSKAQFASDMMVSVISDLAHWMGDEEFLQYDSKSTLSGLEDRVHEAAKQVEVALKALEGVSNTLLKFMRDVSTGGGDES